MKDTNCKVRGLWFSLGHHDSSLGLDDLRIEMTHDFVVIFGPDVTQIIVVSFDLKFDESAVMNHGQYLTCPDPGRGGPSKARPWYDLRFAGSLREGDQPTANQGEHP